MEETQSLSADTGAVSAARGGGGGWIPSPVLSSGVSFQVTQDRSSGGSLPQTPGARQVVTRV